MKKLSLVAHFFSVSLYALPLDCLVEQPTDLYLFAEGIFYLSENELFPIGEIYYENGKYLIKKYVDNPATVGAESGEKVQDLRTGE